MPYEADVLRVLHCDGRVVDNCLRQQLDEYLSNQQPVLNGTIVAYMFPDRVVIVLLPSHTEVKE